MNEESASREEPGRTRYRSYGCVRCQKDHYDDEPIFQQHIGFQSKHGVQMVSAEVRWFKVQQMLATSQQVVNGGSEAR